jgi:hypothetical protein
LNISGQTTGILATYGRYNTNLHPKDWSKRSMPARLCCLKMRDNDPKGWTPQFSIVVPFLSDKLIPLVHDPHTLSYIFV